MGEVTIRDARQGDIPALLRLLGHLDPPGEVVGSVMLAVLPNLSHHAMPFAQLENLVVDEAHRRLGVGRALMGWCMETARAAGCYKLQFQSRNHRKASHGFYRRLGYQALTVGFRRYLRSTPPPLA